MNTFTSNKRARASTDTSSQRRARAISYKINTKYPYTQYGRAYLKRGSPFTTQVFGPTYKSATAAQKAERNLVGYTGKGRYFRGRGGYLGRQAGSWLANAAMATPYGAALRPWAPAVSAMAGAAGSWAEDKGKKFLGMGAYESSNQLIMDEGNMKNAHLINTVMDETGDIYISHREYIGDINAITSPAFVTLYNLYLNPGLPSTFPWLSQLAKYFEEYRFDQLIFEVKSMVSGGNANAGGTICMATQYNPCNEAFTSKQAIETYDYGQSARIEENLYHGVECDPSKKSGNAIEYVRTAGVPANQDQKSFDLGVTQIAISGVPASFGTQTIAELWVNYKVKLSKSKLGSDTLNTAVKSVWGTASASTIEQMFLGRTEQTATPIDKPSASTGTLTTTGGNPFGILIAAPTTTSLKLVFPPTVPQGTYQLNLNMGDIGSSLSVDATMLFAAVKNASIVSQTATKIIVGTNTIYSRVFFTITGAASNQNSVIDVTGLIATNYYKTVEFNMAKITTTY